MTDNQDFTLSIEEENEPGRESGHVNYANDFTENPELRSTKDQDLPKAETIREDEIVVNSKDKTDEWWNHVNSLVKSEEAATSENNNCINIEG